jgi:hypothetical protein
MHKDSKDGNYISAYVSIENYQVWRNGVGLFRRDRENLNEFLEAAYKSLDIPYPKFYKMDSLSKLGFLSAEFLLHPRFRNEPPLDERTAVVLSNSHSSLDTDIKYYRTMDGIPSPALFVYTLPNIMIGEICIRHRFKGENGFFVFNAFDATFMECYVHDLISTGATSACICGWVDLLFEEHKSVIYLVEPQKRPHSLAFTADNINKIYLEHHG